MSNPQIAHKLIKTQSQYRLENAAVEASRFKAPTADVEAE